jgi:hypothetical protein
MEKHLIMEFALYNTILYLGLIPQVLYLQAQYEVHIEQRC